PRFVAELDRWVDPSVAPAVLRQADAQGLARRERWAAGQGAPIPTPANGVGRLTDRPVAKALAKVREEVELDEDDATALLSARGSAFQAVVRAADDLRR